MKIGDWVRVNHCPDYVGEIMRASDHNKLYIDSPAWEVRIGFGNTAWRSNWYEYNLTRLPDEEAMIYILENS